MIYISKTCSVREKKIKYIELLHNKPATILLYSDIIPCFVSVKRFSSAKETRTNFCASLFTCPSRHGPHMIKMHEDFEMLLEYKLTSSI